VRIATLVGSAAVCATAWALAGCGGATTLVASSSSHSARHASVSSAEPTSGTPGRGNHRRGRVYAAKARVQDERHASPAIQRGRRTVVEDESGRSVASFNPCTLVSLSQAQAITRGAIVTRQEAPLGPTCLYRLRRSKSMITVAIESVSLAQVSGRTSTRRAPVEVGGHRGYCARLGAQMLLVPLRGRQLLTVTAPCVLAQRFAAEALKHLAA
jgi:hypothetical protein